VARYRVLERSYISDRLVDAGEEVEYEGVPAHNLEPLDKAAKAAAARAPRAEDAEPGELKELI
jgi:hypothetical protein